MRQVLVESVDLHLFAAKDESETERTESDTVEVNGREVNEAYN